MTKLDDAVQAYLDVRLANQLDLTVEQVKTTNRLEETHERELAQEDAEAVRMTGSCAYIPEQYRRFAVELESGRLFVEWRESGILWRCEVLADGSIEVEPS